MSEATASDFPVRQEDDVVASPRIVRIALASIVIGAIGVFFAGVILTANVGTLQPDVAGPAGPRPAQREIAKVEQTMVGDARDGLDLRDAQKRELERWRWVDRGAGVATIPIEDAMRIVVQEAP